jgi:uncharacterized protein (TIRG00374 family)
MKRTDLIRALVIFGVAGFFGFRYFQSESIIYLAFLIGFGGLGLLSLIRRAPASWQNIGLNLGISLLFLDFVFAEIEWRSFGRALTGANYWMLIPSIMALFIHLYFRTLRWQWLLKPMGEVSFWPAFRGLVIGIMGNTVLPARAGEFLRAYVLGRSTGLSKTGVFATLVVERIFDGITVLLVLLGVIIWGVRNEDLQRAGILGAVFYVGAMAAVIVFVMQRHWADWLINKFLPQNMARPLLGILDGFSSGLAILKNPSQLGMVTFLNILTWIFIPISFWFSLLAFDFGSPVPWTAPVLMLPALALAFTVPGAPGGVGLVQLAVKLTLDTTFAGLPVAPDFEEKVAAASIVIHISQLGPEVVLGFFSIMIEGLSTSDIKAGRQIADAAPPATSYSPE